MFGSSAHPLPPAFCLSDARHVDAPGSFRAVPRCWHPVELSEVCLFPSRSQPRCVCRIPVLQVSTGSRAIIQMSPNVRMFVIAKEHLGAQSPFRVHSRLWHSHRLGLSCPGYSTINSLSGARGGGGGPGMEQMPPQAPFLLRGRQPGLCGRRSLPGPQCGASGGHVPHAFLWDELPRLDMPHRETGRTTLAPATAPHWSRAVSRPEVQQVSP